MSKIVRFVLASGLALAVAACAPPPPPPQSVAPPPAKKLDAKTQMETGKTY